MKTSKEFRTFTAGIKTAMSTFSIVSIQIDVALLESEVGRKRAGDVFKLIGSNLRQADCGTRESMLAFKMQTKKLRLAVRRQLLRNLDRETGVQHIYYPECDS